MKAGESRSERTRLSLFEHRENSSPPHPLSPPLSPTSLSLPKPSFCLTPLSFASRRREYSPCRLEPRSAFASDVALNLKRPPCEPGKQRRRNELNGKSKFLRLQATLIKILLKQSVPSTPLYLTMNHFSAAYVRSPPCCLLINIVGVW